jgi:hypothetical protein
MKQALYPGILFACMAAVCIVYTCDDSGTGTNGDDATPPAFVGTWIFPLSPDSGSGKTINQFSPVELVTDTVDITFDLMMQNNAFTMVAWDAGKNDTVSYFEGTWEEYANGDSVRLVPDVCKALDTASGTLETLSSCETIELSTKSGKLNVDKTPPTWTIPLTAVASTMEAMGTQLPQEILDFGIEIVLRKQMQN